MPFRWPACNDGLKSSKRVSRFKVDTIVDEIMDKTIPRVLIGSRAGGVDKSKLMLWLEAEK